jgi:hypothetical protein
MEHLGQLEQLRGHPPGSGQLRHAGLPDSVPTADRTNTNDIVNLQPAAMQFTG